ncbi:GNAT family N-acetyltransferase, partial [Streptomyces mirabilis]|uniref:GNAT family N-acetyltransferase n=1 Tax=Streptomyces mirabilis TaxID=68239 RepID=UPI0033BD4C2E
AAELLADVLHPAAPAAPAVGRAGYSVGTSSPGVRAGGTEHRHRGVGTRLLNQCLHHAHTHGAAHLTADVPDGDIAAARLLAKTGFLAVDTLTVYHRRP